MLSFQNKMILVLKEKWILKNISFSCFCNNILSSKIYFSISTPRLNFFVSFKDNEIVKSVGKCIKVWGHFCFGFHFIIILYLLPHNVTASLPQAILPRKNRIGLYHRWLIDWSTYVMIIDLTDRQTKWRLIAEWLYQP